MQGKQLDPIPLLLPLNLLLLVPFGHLLEKVKTKVLERWCALPLSVLYSFSAAAVTASWQLHTVNRFMKAMCIQALPSTLLSCQEQNNLGNVYSSRSIHIVYVYSSPCVHIHHVYLSSTLKKSSFVRNWHGPCPELTAFFGNVKNNICSAKYNFRKIFYKCHMVYCKHRKTTLISKMFFVIQLHWQTQTFLTKFLCKIWVKTWKKLFLENGYWNWKA